MSSPEPRKAPAALHGGLFLVVLATVNLGLPALHWPWYLLLPLTTYSALVLLSAPLRRTAPRLAIGCITGWPLVSAAALSVATAGVLVAYHFLAKPDATDLAAHFPIAMVGNLALAGALFSLVNATLEEVVFRGILWEVLATEWNVAVAIAITSVLFGFVHVHGYPPGPLGAILAGIYGMTLGLLRIWSGGLALVVACHVCADATIFVLLTTS